MKIAVTGATGHIGNVLCRLLVERGHEVTGLIRKDTAATQDLKISKVSGDVHDNDRLDELMANADAVVHLAAIISIGHIPDNEVYAVNVGGTKNVLAAAQRNGVSRVYHVSSIHAHKSPGLNGILDESAPYVDPSRTGYDRSKADAERAVIAARDSGLMTTVFNPTAVMGPYDFKPGFTGKAVIQLCERKIPMLTPLGYDWTDVRDVAAAICTAIENQIANDKFLLPGAWHSLAELAAIIKSYTGVHTPKYTAPFWLAKAGVPFMKLQGQLSGRPPLYTAESLRTIQESCRNVQKDHAARILNYAPRPLEETIPDTIDWLRQTNYLKT